MFLMAVGELTGPELALQVQRDQIRRWQRGEAVPLESYLDNLPALRDQYDAVVDLIDTEVRLREQTDNKPTLSEYQRRFPRYARELSVRFGELAAEKAEASPYAPSADGLPRPAPEADSPGEMICFDQVERPPLPPDLSGEVPDFEVLRDRHFQPTNGSHNHEPHPTDGPTVVPTDPAPRARASRPTDLMPPGTVPGVSGPGLPPAPAGWSFSNPSPPAGGAAPKSVGGYEVLRELGSDTHSTLYLVRQVGTNRSAALKLYHVFGPEAEPVRRRLGQVSEVVARVPPTHFARVLQVGDHDGRPFLVREYVEGVSLAAQLQRGSLPPLLAAHLAQTLAGALHDVHQRGLTHGRLKPANVIFGPGENGQNAIAGIVAAAGEMPATLGLPRLVDFSGAVPGGKPMTSAPGESARLFDYYAPEQVRGEPAAFGPRTDVHALGVLLYEMLTGRPPYRSALPAETMRQIADEKPLPPSRWQPRVPAGLEAVVLKCLQKPPQARYPSAAAVADDLRAFLTGRPVGPDAGEGSSGLRPLRWVRRRPLLTGLAAGALITGGYLAFNPGRFNLTQAQPDDGGTPPPNQVTRSEPQSAPTPPPNPDTVAPPVVQLTHPPAGNPAGPDPKVEEERQKLEAALTRAQADAYRGRVALAEAAVLQGQPARAAELLADCPADRRDWEWGYLHRLGQARGLTVAEPTGRVRAVAVSPDGKYLATAGAGPRSLRLWGAADGKPVATLDGHTAVAFSGDNRWVAAAGEGNTVYVWDRSDLAGKPRVLAGHTGPVRSVAFRADGRQLATAGDDQKVRLWDPTDLKASPLVLGDLGGRVAAVTYSPDGKLVAVAAGSGVRFFQTSGEPVQPELKHPDKNLVTCLAFSPDGRTLATGCTDNKLRLWEVTSGRELRALEGHAQAIQDVAFSPDGSRLASVAWDGTARVWESETGKPVLQLPGLSGVTFTRDGRRLFAAQHDRTASTWEAAPRPAGVALPGHTDSVIGVAASGDGKTWASAGRDRTVRLWDPATRQPRGEPLHFSKSVQALALSPDGQTLAVAAGDFLDSGATEGELKLVRLADRKETPLVGHAASVLGLAFSPDGRTLASGGVDQTVRLWEVTTGCEVRALTGHTNVVNGVAFSPDGTRLASAGSDRTVRVWQVGDGQPLFALDGSGSTMNAVAFSPDGGTLAGGNRNGGILLWDAKTGRETAALVGHGGAVTGLAFHPGGRLASASSDRTARLWDPAAGQELLSLRHPDVVYGVAWSSDGRSLLTAGEDRAVRVWEGASASVRTTPAGPPAGDTDPSSVPRAGRGATHRGIGR
jgi:WD40 repeat protein/serine/threonine protein kinase